MFFDAILLGLIATAVMDLAAFAQKRLLGVPGLNYALVGRWLGHIPKGRLVHHRIAQSPSVFGEALLGWAAHYLIGVLFAALFLWMVACGLIKGQGPTGPLLFGLSTVIAPFFLLQPGMGAGVAARLTQAPWVARARSIIAHLTFGLGLWLGNVILALVAR